MKNITIILSALLLFLLPSCKKYLDIKPKGILIPEFYDDYVKLLNHKTMMSADNPYVVYITDDMLLGDLSVPFGQFQQGSEGQKNMYSFAHGSIFSAGTDDLLWQNAYKRIYTFNVVINNVLSCTDGNPKDKEALAAEAKVGRAFEYLLLVNTYAKDYDANSAANDLGVPLVLSEDINKDYKRNTVREVYDQIFKDLNEALPHLSATTPHRFKPSRQVGNAFMAKMYFYMKDYENARIYAEKALLDNSQLTNMKLYSINPAANGFGRIYDAATGKSYPEAKDNVESIYARYGDNLISLSRNVYASADLLATYNHDLPPGATDQRRLLFFADNTFKLNGQLNFPGKSMWVPYVMFNSGFNTSELFLIAAEGYARKGEAQKALALVDKLRYNRINGNKDLPLVDAKMALKIVLEERRREFAFCGSMRLIDLKRLNREADWKKDIVHSAGSESWTLPANDLRYILPLPPKVLSLNPSLPQYNRD
ncbi:RagB/SusD family nutrient uptake outer membrane protein [Pedobacter nyackensis]|uniref:SusD family protein n=1 Tax=Pedobacter nyackensis TaxID=475255 RepID=A0A1W2BCQ6_9SPHI|nr:RagB/SusD family nutrient uptake outer membrane protein [Pedobacter nyackensis]SMC70689.1 SusD family protein [Pedobacter nyackensis]